MSGGLKDAVGKPKMHKVSKEVIWEMQRVHDFGDNKYEEGNWRLGIPNALIEMTEAAKRHIDKLQDGLVEDEESGLNHLAHALVNLEILLYYFLHKKDYKDCLVFPLRPKRHKD